MIVFNGVGGKGNRLRRHNKEQETTFSLDCSTTLSELQFGHADMDVQFLIIGFTIHRQYKFLDQLQTRK